MLILTKRQQKQRKHLIKIRRARYTNNMKITRYIIIGGIILSFAQAFAGYGFRLTCADHTSAVVITVERPYTNGHSGPLEVQWVTMTNGYEETFNSPLIAATGIESQFQDGFKAETEKSFVRVLHLKAHQFYKANVTIDGQLHRGMACQRVH